jgi:hypothetical protein
MNDKKIIELLIKLKDLQLDLYSKQGDALDIVIAILSNYLNKDIENPDEMLTKKDILNLTNEEAE